MCRKNDNERDIASLIGQFYTNYVGKELGTVNVCKIICPLDQFEVFVRLTVLFKKGNPLLDSFNILMRRYLEAGLLEMH
jgi:TM2 domain-containing membrane protein YozV